MGFERITIVSVTGLQAVAAGAVRALVLSGARMPGARLLLISPHVPDGLPPAVRHRRIASFGYMEYSVFMLYGLREFIETEFALVVQDDGWVLDSGAWDPAFLDYDYVGAPIHLGRVTAAGHAVVTRGFDWTHALADPAASVDIVMNGGFSLRSRRLLDAPRSLGVPFVVPPMTGLRGDPPAMHWQYDDVMEDVWLCLQARSRLEQGGLRFAPLALARRFAIEHGCPVLHGQRADFDTFGHHSRVRRLVGTDPPTVDYRLDHGQVAGIYGEAAIVDRLLGTGHHIRFPPSG